MPMEEESMMRGCGGVWSRVVCQGAGVYLFQYMVACSSSLLWVVSVVVCVWRVLKKVRLECHTV